MVSIAKKGKHLRVICTYHIIGCFVTGLTSSLFRMANPSYESKSLIIDEVVFLVTPLYGRASITNRVHIPRLR